MSNETDGTYAGNGFYMNRTWLACVKWGVLGCYT